MIETKITIKGLKPLLKHQEGAIKRLRKGLYRVLDINAGEVVNNAKRILKKKLNKGRSPIVNSISKKKPRVFKNKSKVTIGWKLPYGQYLEYAPTKKVWTIKARFKKALRFMVGNKVIYTKQVKHTWKASTHLKEHFKPAMKKQKKKFEKDLTKLFESLI